MKINIKVFYKLIGIFTGHCQSCPKYLKHSKFVIYLQYLEEEGRDEFDFLHADKHQTILQVDTINFGEHNSEACSNYPK